MQKRQFEISVEPGRIIRGDFRVPDYPENKPLIIFCHGFKGFKDWGGWQYAMDKFCGNGFFVIAMNFSLNGIGPDLQNFTELDRFSVNTIGRELEDIKCLVDSVEQGGTFPELEHNPKIGLIGHSRGGGTSILLASQNRNIDALITWACVANFDNYLAKKDEWHNKGYIEFENTRTQQIMRMKLDFLYDLEANPEKRNILLAEQNLNIPHLIIHGDADEAVPPDQARALLDSADKTRTTLEIISGASHTFGTAHPFNGSTQAFDNVIDKTTRWFSTFLSV